MPHLVEPSSVYQVLRVDAYATPCGANIFLILLHDQVISKKSWNYNLINDRTHWTKCTHIYSLFIIANKNIMWSYFRWNLYVCNNMFMCTFTYWIALLTKPVLDAILVLANAANWKGPKDKGCESWSLMRQSTCSYAQYELDNGSLNPKASLCNNWQLLEHVHSSFIELPAMGQCGSIQIMENNYITSPPVQWFFSNTKHCSF